MLINYSMRFFPLSHGALNLQLLTLRKLAVIRSPTSILEVFSDQNKRRCQAQLAALETSKHHSELIAKAKRKAAVLIPLCYVDCQPSIVFTLRSNQLRSHRGQVSFPGGVKSKEDKNFTETALRESYEEIGIDVGRVDIWGSMLPLPDRLGETQITPIIANIGEINIDELSINYDEVDTVFTRDLLSLCQADSFAQTTFQQKGKSSASYTLPVFLGGEHKIWGLTAIILHQTLSLIAPGEPGLEPNGKEVVPTSPPNRHGKPIHRN